MTNSTFSGNGNSAADGGGIYNKSGSTIDVTTSEFSGNSAANGGSIYNGGTLTLDTSTFSGNRAFFFGGGVVNNGGSTATVTNSTFSNNSSSSGGYGGGGITNFAILNMTNSSFSGNSAYFGGGIENINGTLTLANSTFSGNNANNNGGGIYNSSGILIIKNSTFSGNSATNGGGINNDLGTLTMANTIIANSTTGGDCVGTNTAPSINNLIEDTTNACGLTDNVNGNIIGSDPNLGPLANNGGPTQTHALITGSPAINAASAGFCPSIDQRGITRPQGANCDIGAFEYTGATFTIWYVTTTGDDANSCTTIGSPCLTINGAIGKAASGDTVYVATGTYTGSGAEVVLINKSLALSGGWDSTFTAQSGMSIIDGQGARRGITVPLGITATVHTFKVQNGYHDNQGGGIRNNGTLTVKNSVIQNNISGWMGGGIFSLGILTIDGTIIDSNTAGHLSWSGGGGGGGIQNFGGTAIINNSTISNNILLGFFDGSAINTINISNILILNNSTVSGNINRDSINGSNGSITINNSTISSNSGIGIGIASGSLFLNNSTISNNKSGIEISSIYSKVNLMNSIIANNTGYDCSGSLTSTGYNLIGNSSGCTFSATTGDLVGTILSPIDPKLGPLQDNGGPTFTHNLLWGSPAMDAGNPAAPGSGGNACLSTDQRGVTRPIDDNVIGGAICDIGAVEFNDNTPKVVITSTSYNANEQIPLNLHGTGISVGDINDDPLTVTVSTTDANSQIFANAGSTGAVISSGNGTNSLMLTGSVAQLNNLFAGNLGSTFSYLLNDDTPTANVTITITADDGSSTGSDTAIITITAINDSPVNSVPGTQTMDEDTALIFSAGNGNQISVNDVDVNTDSLEITLSTTNGTVTLAGTTGLNFTTGDGAADTSMVFQGALTDINNALGTLTFDPIVNYYGSAVLTFTTNDLGNTGIGGTLIDTDAVNITINNVNDAPFVANAIPDQNATEDMVFNFQFAANTFSDPDVSDNISYSAQRSGGGALPAWLSFDPVTRTFSGTPANGDVGMLSIDVIADDGNGGTVTDAFNITVTNVNNPPTIANPIPDQNATEDAAFNFQFAANTFSDPDVGETLTYSVQLAGGSPLPAWLSFNAATRTFSGTPLNSDVGIVSIDVIANDGNGRTVTEAFDIVIANTNDAPVITNPIPDQNATANQAFNYQFPVNTFSDPDVGDTLTYSAQLTGSGAIPAWLTFNSTTRTFSGTPTTGDTDIVPIDVIADDGNGGTVTDAFNITVNLSAPVVTSVHTTNPDGTYKIGDEILITITFDQPINVNTSVGIPSILLETGTTDHTASYISGSGTNTLTFQYVVIAGDASPDLDYQSTAALALNGGIILSGSSTPAILTLPAPGEVISIAGQHNIVIDGIAFGILTTSLSPTYTSGPVTFTVTFDDNASDPIGNSDPDDVTNPNNYLLVEDGGNGIFDTKSCLGGVLSDDTQIITSTVIYSSKKATVSLSVVPPVGTYRLFICGTTSIVDLAGNPLAGNGSLSGTDYTFDFVVHTSNNTNTTGPDLPSTGFTPNHRTYLPPQPADLAYAKTGDIWLEIPSLKIKTNIVGVPKIDNNWDVTWLGKDAGWLNGTAFPTWEGNSVITAHVTDANGLPGPFANIKDLKYGEQIIIHINRQKYIFEVRNSLTVRSSDTKSAFEHLEGHSYLTLITCQEYDPTHGSYLFRRILRAVLVKVQNE
ncbi:MAG: putative Ig domain-containing protein [Anaerolineales bacterium]